VVEVPPAEGTDTRVVDQRVQVPELALERLAAA
jgi:hypothetical protein